MRRRLGELVSRARALTIVSRSTWVDETELEYGQIGEDFFFVVKLSLSLLKVTAWGTVLRSCLIIIFILSCLVLSLSSL